MNLLKFAIIIVLVPLTGFAQAKTSNESDTTENNIEEKFKTFSEASSFFFTTLDENFEGDSKGENMYKLMQIFASPKEEPEDFFRLQVNAIFFRTLNASLESIYDDFFPVHIYIYEKNSEFNYVRGKIVSNKVLDTIEDRIPTNMPDYVPRNSFVEGFFKHSFAEQILSDKTDSKVKSELQPLLDFSNRYSALNFSIDFSNKFNAKQFNEIYDSEYNRILTSLVFWEYLADCANYDLNTRTYFYED